MWRGAREWICCCLGDHQTVVRNSKTTHIHRRPPDEQTDSQEEKAAEVIQSVDTHDQEAVIRNSRGIDIKKSSNTQEKKPPVCLPVTLSVCSAGCLWISALTYARAFSSVWKEKGREADGGEWFIPPCSYNVTLTRSSMENELPKMEEMTVNISWMIFWV